MYEPGIKIHPFPVPLSVKLGELGLWRQAAHLPNDIGEYMQLLAGVEGDSIDKDTLAVLRIFYDCTWGHDDRASFPTDWPEDLVEKVYTASKQESFHSIEVWSTNASPENQQESIALGIARVKGELRHYFLGRWTQGQEKGLASLSHIQMVAMEYCRQVAGDWTEDSITEAIKRWGYRRWIIYACLVVIIVTPVVKFSLFPEAIFPLSMLGSLFVIFGELWYRNFVRKMNRVRESLALLEAFQNRTFAF